MASSDAPIRELGLGDLGAALALTRAAGWNQTEDDWRYMLAAGRAFGIAPGGEIAAAALALPYRGFGWISMVLVAEAQRRRGLATRLMERCIATLEDAGLVPYLDATAAGREVYRRMGFADVWTFQRHVIATEFDLPPPPWGIAIRRLQPDDYDAVIAFDEEAFGSERGALLRHLAERAPKAAWIAKGSGEIVGYGLGREGHDAFQIGPVVAGHPLIALGLIARALVEARRPVYIDLPDAQKIAATWLAANSAVVQRAFTRMRRGGDKASGDAGRIYAVAGPEFG